MNSSLGGTSMSLRDVSMIYLLGEDAGHRSFVRAWLNANGVHVHRLYVVEPTAGKSGGSKFVLANCKATVNDARRRNSTKGETRVIIAIDADDNTVEERVSEIRRTIDERGAGDDLDLVCVLVPRRHIETWAQALGSAQGQVNEQDNYKPKTTEEIKSAARRLAGLRSAPAAPPSLAHGYAQFQRLKDM